MKKTRRTSKKKGHRGLPDMNEMMKMFGQQGDQGRGGMPDMNEMMMKMFGQQGGQGDQGGGLPDMNEMMKMFGQQGGQGDQGGGMPDMNEMMKMFGKQGGQGDQGGGMPDINEMMMKMFGQQEGQGDQGGGMPDMNEMMKMFGQQGGQGDQGKAPDINEMMQNFGQQGGGMPDMNEMMQMFGQQGGQNLENMDMNEMTKMFGQGVQGKTPDMKDVMKILEQDPKADNKNTKEKRSGKSTKSGNFSDNKSPYQWAKEKFQEREEKNESEFETISQEQEDYEINENDPNVPWKDILEGKYEPTVYDEDEDPEKEKRWKKMEQRRLAKLYEELGDEKRYHSESEPPTEENTELEEDHVKEDYDEQINRLLMKIKGTREAIDDPDPTSSKKAKDVRKNFVDKRKNKDPNGILEDVISQEEYVDPNEKGDDDDDEEDEENETDTDDSNPDELGSDEDFFKKVKKKHRLSQRELDKRERKRRQRFGIHPDSAKKKLKKDQKNLKNHQHEFIQQLHGLQQQTEKFKKQQEKFKKQKEKFQQEKTAFHYLKTGWIKDIARDPTFFQRQVRSIMRELMTLWVTNERGKIKTPIKEILRNHVFIDKVDLLNPEAYFKSTIIAAWVNWYSGLELTAESIEMTLINANVKSERATMAIEMVVKNQKIVERYFTDYTYLPKTHPTWKYEDLEKGLTPEIHETRGESIESPIPDFDFNHPNWSEQMKQMIEEQKEKAYLKIQSFQEYLSNYPEQPENMNFAQYVVSKQFQKDCQQIPFPLISQQTPEQPALEKNYYNFLNENMGLNIKREDHMSDEDRYNSIIEEGKKNSLHFFTQLIGHDTQFSDIEINTQVFEGFFRRHTKGPEISKKFNESIQKIVNTKNIDPKDWDAFEICDDIMREEYCDFKKNWKNDEFLTLPDQLESNDLVQELEKDFKKNYKESESDLKFDPDREIDENLIESMFKHIDIRGQKEQEIYDKMKQSMKELLKLQTPKKEVKEKSKSRPLDWNKASEILQNDRRKFWNDEVKYFKEGLQKMEIPQTQKEILTKEFRYRSQVLKMADLANEHLGQDFTRIPIDIMQDILFSKKEEDLMEEILKDPNFQEKLKEEENLLYNPPKINTQPTTQIETTTQIDTTQTQIDTTKISSFNRNKNENDDSHTFDTLPSDD